jgi:class 3 adenylate cyclase/TolB-like protein/Tfp pilus assembly protein PilF
MAQQRQLAAILFTDIVGYTALMQENEHKAILVINHYNEVLNKCVARHQGKVLNNFGDGSLCTFNSVSDALACSIEIQNELRQEPVVPLRIGLHVGEVIVDDTKAMGDGVNLASRVQSLGQANAILFSREVYDKIRNRPEYKAVSLGQFQFKNVRDPIEVFALANEGFFVPKRNKMDGKLEKSPWNIRKRISLMGILALVILGGLIYWNFSSKKGFTGKNKSIVVLPFANLSGNKDKDYVSAGFTDDIITKLYNITGLRTMSRTTSYAFRDSKLTAEQIAEQLNVASVLEGDVQLEGERVKINVRFTDANTGNSLWSNEFNGNIKDLIEVQAEVAEAIASHLNQNINDSEKRLIEKKPTDEIEAWKMYQQGRSFWYKRSEANLKLAINFFKQAIQLDPHYARAYSGLADCYSWLGYGSFVKPADAFPEAERFADSAIKKDPNLAEPHASLGYVKFYYYWNWAEAEKEFREAIRLNSQYDWAHDNYAYLLASQERLPEAMEQAKIAMEISPQPSPFMTDMGWTQYYNKKYDDAQQTLLEATRTSPSNPLAMVWLARTYQAKKMYPEAINQNLKALQLQPNWVVGLAALGYIYGITGKKDSALYYLNRMDTLSSSRYMSPYGFALIYASLKDYDKTFEWLEKAYIDRANWMVWLKQDPRWDPIRSDKRYPPLVAKIGLPPINSNTANR